MTIRYFSLITFILLTLVACKSETNTIVSEKNDPSDKKILLGQFEKENKLVFESVTQKYICPMHSHIIADHEGNCPICGMDLVARRIGVSEITNQEKQNNSREYETVEIPAANLQKLAIKTEIVRLGDLKHQIETLGKITRIDPMAKSRITSPIKGKLSYIVDKYSGDTVKRDEHLFSVVSELLFSIQDELKIAYTNGEKAKANRLVDTLFTMGIDAEQIAKLQQGTIDNLAVKIYALEDGFIFAKRGQVGQKITDSFTVFNLGGNYQVVEVTAEIFERQWDLVKEGQAASMRMRNLPGELFTGIVERVDEPVGYTTRALEVRIKFRTERTDLAQSTFARVFIEGKTRHNLVTLARDSVIRTVRGDRVIKVLKNGFFKPVEVKVGEESNGRIEIISGITVGDVVVSSGQFIIDSESNILSALRRMANDEKDF